MAGAPDDEKLAAMIARLDVDDVADLLVRAALEHDDVARAVRLAAADDGDRLQVLRQAVDASLRTRRFLDYWASSRWAADAAPVVDALRQEAERQQSKELVALIERGIGHLVKVLLTAGTHAPLRSNDAIPLAVAIRLGTDKIATYKVSSQTLRTPPDSRSSPRRLMDLLRPTEWSSFNDHVHRPCHVGRGRRTALPDRRHRRHTSKQVRT